MKVMYNKNSISNADAQEWQPIKGILSNQMLAPIDRISEILQL